MHVTLTLPYYWRFNDNWRSLVRIGFIPTLTTALLLCNGPLFGTATKTKQNPPPPPPWDADLFRRNESVVSGHVEFLYWKPEEGALDYALKMKTPAWSNTVDSYAQGNFERSTFDISPGFRIGVGYFRAPKEWEVFGFYTRLSSSGNNSVERPTAAGEYLTATWPQILTVLTSAKTSLSLHYNVVDLLVDRYFNPNNHLRLRLMGGITGAWIDQTWSVRYFDNLSNTTFVRSDWKFGGGGFKAAMMVDWFWTCDIYMTIHASLGGLIGPYKNRTKQTTSLSVSGSNPAIPIRNAKYEDVRIAPTVQLSLGPSWQKNFSSTRIELFAGYEITGWMNLQEVYHSTAGVPFATKETWINTSLLALQGLTTRLSADF